LCHRHLLVARSRQHRAIRRRVPTSSQRARQSFECFHADLHINAWLRATLEQAVVGIVFIRLSIFHIFKVEKPPFSVSLRFKRGPIQ